MKKTRLENTVKGWFVGNFTPTTIKTNAVEVAVKEYKKGDYEVIHYHKIATEITVIVSGKVLMNNIEFSKGDIIQVDPLEAVDFRVLEDTVTTVVKFPGVNDDKYLGDSYD
jgi:hypothetical protein